MKNAREGKDVLAMRLGFAEFALLGREFSNFMSSDVFSDWTSRPQVTATRSDCCEKTKAAIS